MKARDVETIQTIDAVPGDWLVDYLPAGRVGPEEHGPRSVLVTGPVNECLDHGYPCVRFRSGDSIVGGRATDLVGAARRAR